MYLILRPYKLFTSVFKKALHRPPITNRVHFFRLILSSAILTLSALAFSANAATYYSRQSGNWNSNTTWSLTSGGGAVGAGVFPVAGDIVIIERGFTVTVTANAASTSIQLGATPATGGINFGTLTFGGAFQLIVSGNVAVGGNGNNARRGTINFANGSLLDAGIVTLGSSGATPGTPNLINMTSGGTLRADGLSVNAGPVNNWTPGAGTVELQSTNTLPSSVFTSFNNLTINGGTTSLGVDVSIAGTLSVASGVFAIGAFDVSSVGAVNMTGTSITGTGTLTLAGDVTTNASATASTIAVPIALGGSTRTFNVDDTAAIPDLNVTGAISGGGGIIKTGIGSMNLANAGNSYTGSTTANQGILRIAAFGGTIPNGSALIVNSTLDLNGYSETVGSLAGIGTVTSNAGATMTLTAGGDNTSTTFSGVIQNGSSTGVSLSKTGSGALNLSGNNSYSGATSLLGGTLNMNSASAIGTSALTIFSGTTIGNTSASAITLSTNNTVNLNGDFSFGGTQDLNLGTGTTSLSSARGVTVNSNTLTLGGTINTGFSLFKSGAGTLSFGSNPVTLNSLTISSGPLTSTSGVLSITGSLSNSGAFNHNSGTVHYNGGAVQTVTALSYNNLALSGAGQKNAGGAITVDGNLTNSSIFDLGANALSVTGTIDNTGGNIRYTGVANGIAVNTGTVTYYGASQTVGAGTYNDLVINQSAGQASLGGAVTINGVLTMNNGILNLNGFDLTFGTAASISIAAPSATKMILVASGNKVIKTYGANGSFTFPIGENTGVAEYSPITVNVTAGSGFPANLDVTVFDLKHPNNSSTTNFLTRYWEVTSNITGGVATVSTNYPSADITGAEGSISAAQLPGAFNQASNPWIKYSALGANTLTAVAAPLSSGQINAFTGITGAAPTATIVGGGVTICTGASVNLSTNVTGDPTFTYSWSPATGLSATNISNPVATPLVTTIYTVTIRDGNGIIATDNTTITVDTPPTPTIGTSGSTVCDGVNPDVTLTSSVAPNGGTYLWYKGGIATGDVGINLTVNDPAGSGSYTVSVIDGVSGCTSAQSAAEVVTINPLPIDKVVSALTALTICNGGTIVIRITSSEPGVNYEIQDQLNNPVRAIAGGTGADLDLITNPLNASVTSLKVVATNVSTTCARTLTNLIGPVTVNPIPATPTIGPVGPVVVCEGTAAIVLTSSAGAGNQWYKDGAPIGGATATTLNITTLPGNSGSYTVISTVSGCSSLVSVATSVTIDPLPLVTPIVTPATTTVCNGSTVTVNVAGSQAGINYELFNGGTSLSSTTAGTGGAINLVTSALTANTTITVRATNPVTSCSVLLTGTSVVTVNPIPVTPTINPVGPVVVCEGTAAIVLTSSAGAGNQWYKDGSPIGGATATTLNITTLPGNSGSYTVISTVSGCSSLVSVATSVTINPLPLVTPIVTPATTTVCNGSTVTVNVAGSQAGINYELFNGGTSLSSTTAGTGGAINLVTSALTANTTITVRATNPVTSCSVLLTGTSVVTVNPIPVTPTINPVGPVVVCEGTAAIVLTSSAGAGNQWYKDGSPIGGATATTLNITTLPGNSGSYTVISTVSGCSSLVSVATSVTINPLPLVTPIVTPATTTVCNGSTVTVNVAGSQAGINYELFNGGTSLSSTTAGTGGAINLVTSALTANTTITVRATNPVTSCSVLLTGTSVVTVNPIPVTPTINPVGPVVVCEGTAAIVLTSSAGAGNQWYKDGALIGGATATTLNITTLPGNSGSYTVISTVSGCSSLVSVATSVTIDPLPLVTPIVTPATTTVCNGSTVTVNVAGSQAGINYELFNGGTSLSSTTAGTGGAINLVTSALTANTTITVRATNPVTSCSVLLTGTSVVTVNPIPVTPTINPVGPVVVCEGTAAIVLTSSAGAGNQWYKDGSPIGGATATTLNITTLPGNSGSYTVISTVSGCSSLVSVATSVTINPLPLVTPIVTPATTTVCNGSTVTVNVAGSQAGINYELFNGGTSLSSTTAGTGGAINLVTSALTANTTITVRATNPVTSCSVLLTGTSVVTVNPIPVTPTINPVGPVVVCEGTAAIVLTSSAGAGNQWYKDGSPIGGATATTLNITTLPGNSGSYTVISTVSGCSSLVSVATSVTINPLPLVTPIVTPATTTVCNGSTVTVNVAGSQAGINYELFNGGTSLSSTTAGTGGAINLVTSALTANTTITVRATNPVTSCSVLLTGTSVVTVNPIPVTPTINPVGPVVVCEGTAAIVLTSSAGAGNQWYKDGALIGGATATTLNITTLPGNSGSYTVISTVSGCASLVSAATSVTINALPLVTPIVTPATTTVCNGSTVTVNVAGSQAGINYELFNGGTSLSSTTAGTGGAINLVTSALTANTTITVRATNPVTSCSVLLTGTSVVTVNPIPVTPTINPVGPVVVCEGTAAIVLTSSAGAGNQWYKDGSPIGGATATTLNITTLPGNSGSYTVISTVSGCSSLVSVATSVTINPLPLVTPIVTPATTTVCNGSTVTVNVAGSQAGINYELFNGGTSLSSTTAGTGGAINLVTSALTANTTITVRATNPVTSCSVLLTGTSVVTVNPIPVTPTINPVGPVVVCEGTAAIVLTSSAGAGNQWYKDGALIGGATATTLNITTLPGNSGSYTVISTVSGCSSLVSVATSVTIDPLPLVTPIVTPATTTVCNGSTVTVNVAGSQAGINYELFNGGTSLSSTTAGTGGAINLVTSALTANTTITVRATNPVTSCSVLLTGTSVVTVNPIPVTPTINPVGPVVVCEGTAAIVLTSSAGAGNQWYKDGSPIGGATATTLNITTLPGNSGSYTVISTVSGCSSLVSVATSVTINPLPLVTPIVTPATTTVCNGSTVTVNVAGSQAGINYELFNGGTSLSSTTAGTGGAINLVTSALTANTTITVRATNPVTSCSVLLTGTSVVTVNPIPVTPTINPVGPVVVCEGTAAIVLTSSAGAGNQWYKDGSPIGGATATTLNITTLPGNSGSYTVISTVSGCSSLVSVATSVTINPLPLVTPIVTPATTTVCNGSTVTVNVAGSQAGINYELFNGGTSLSSTTAGTGGAINLVTSALTANTTITVRATNPVTSCSVLLTGTSVVTVNPIPVTPTINPVGPVVVCEGTAAIVLTSSAGAGNQWYKDGALIGGATATTLNITTLPGNSGSYTVISTVSGCASLVSAATSVTINALPLVTPIVTPATTTVCNGSTVTVNVAGSQAGINYELFNGGTSLSSTTAGTGGAINLVTSALTANTTITVRATNPVTSCSVLLTGTSVVTVNPIPVTPTINPVGPVVVCEGTAAIVLTSSAGAGNQWYKDGSPIGGATATTLNITTLPGNSGSYTVISTVSGCASGVSAAVAVTINQLPLTSVGVSPVSAIICSGSTVTVSLTGTETGINYQLFDGPSPLSAAVAGTGVINITTTPIIANITISVFATNPVTGCAILLGGTTAVTLSATIPTPIISPPGPLAVCVGDPAVILTSSAASGNQWYKDGVPISGAINQTLSVSTGVVNSGSYTVIETQAGCTSGVSTAVDITVNSIASQPPAPNPAPICVGGTIPTLTAVGTNLIWYSDAGLTTQVGTGSPFTPTAAEVNTAVAGTYSLYVTQTIGCESLPTQVDVLVNPAVTVDAGTDSDLCLGQNITLGGSPTASGGSGSYTYSWTSVPAGFTSTQSNPVVTPVLGLTTYQVLVTDAFGCQGTAQVDITVYEIPTFTVTNNTSGGTGEVCSGSAINISLTSPTAGATITLQNVNYGAVTGGVYAAGGAFVSGNFITEPSGLVNPTNAPISINYIFSVATPNCSNPITQQSQIVVNPTPTMSTVNSATQICSNSSVNIVLNSPTSGATIRLASVNYGSASGTLLTGATFTPGASITETLINSTASAVTVQYNFEVLANGCTTAGFSESVLVNPNPTFIISNTLPEICSGANTNILFGSGTAGHQINVVNVFYGLVTGGTVIPGVTTFTSATPLFEALSNNTNAAIDVVYEFNVTTPATTPICPLAPVSQFATVRVNPNPTFTATNNSGGGTGIICSGNPVSILLNTPVSGGQVRLKSINYGGASGTLTAGAIFVNGQTINEIVTNTTAIPIIVAYEFEALVGVCGPSLSQIVNVDVRPVPNVVALPASQTICSGATTSVALSTTNGVAGATYSWTRVDAGVSGVLVGSGATINETLTATGSTPGTATYTITPAAGGCNGTPITVIVTVNPLPDVVAAPASETICSGTTSNINLSTSNGVVGATYSWTVVQSNISGATSGFGTSINQTLTATTSSAGAATYTITPSANGCTGTPIVVVVTVSPVPNVVALPASQTICSGATTSVALSTTNGVAGATYSWTRVDAGVSGVLIGSGTTINETLTATGSVAGTATYTITPAAGGCNGTPITVIVTVNPLPDVVAAPASETICSGTTSNINLSTSNGVAGATYSWTVVQSNVSGATSGFGTSINQTLTATTSSAGTATYTITPSANSCTGSPINVVVTVSPVPNVVALPASQTICSGATTSVALSTTNGVGGATYSWTRVDAGVSGVLVGSGPSINETLTATGSVAGTATYTITPAAGGCNGTPITVIVTVNPLPDVVAAPNAETICSGTTSNINLSTSNGVAGATYSWTVVQSNVSGATSGFGTSINQTLTATTSSAGTATYTITPSANGCTGTPIVVVVTVSPVPNVVALPASQTICSGATTSVALSTTNGVAGATYSWTRVDAGVSGVLIGSGTTINETLTATGSVAGTATYTITPAAGGCNGTPITVIVTVNPLPDVVAAPNAETICSGTTSNINLSTSNGVAGATYSWTVVQSNVSGATSGFGTSINQTLTATTSSAGTATYTITPSANSCTGSPINVVVTVSPVPNVVALPASQTICSGATTSVALSTTNGVGGATYSWTRVDAGVSGVLVGSGPSINETLTATGSVAGTATYTITPAAGGCNGTPITVIVTVNPLPDVVAAPNAETICSGTTSNINLSTSNGVAGATYSWTVVQSNVSGATSGFGTSINQTLTATTSSAGTATYTITPSANSCTGSPINVVVTVSPVPNVVALPASQTICSGATTSVALSTTNGVGGATYSWTRVDAGVSGVLVGSGPSINETLTATGSVAGTATYTITPAAGGCNGTPITVIVTVNPLPDVVAAPNAETICSGTTSNINLSTSNGVAGATYSWTVVQSNVSGATSGFGTSINQTLTATTSSAGTATYTITPSANGCTGTPINIVVTVSPVPNVVALPASQTICSGATTGIALSTTNGVGGATYSWTRVDAGVSGVLVGSGPSINETLTATGSVAGTATYTITPAAGGCNGTPITVIVTVNPLPDVVAAPNAETICSGTTSNINLSTSNGVAGATYSWTVVQSNVSGATSGFGTSINQTLTATTSSAGTATYTITPSANGCTGTPINIVVTVSPKPIITNTALQLLTTICSNTVLNFTPVSTTDPATLYSWTSVVSGSTFTGVLASGTGTITDTPVNTGNTVGYVTYTITPEVAGCFGNSVNYIVTVFPTPTADGSDIIICSGQNAVVLINSLPNNVAGTTFSWVAVPSANVLGAANGNGSTISQTLSVTDFTTGTVVYQITPSANGCAGAVKNITITINPLPTADAGVDYQVCEPTVIPLSGLIGGAATSGTWTIVTGAGSISASTVAGNTVTANYTVNPSDIATTIVLKLESNDPDLGEPCTIASDLLSIQINRRPTVIAPADFVVCEPANLLASPISLSGTIGGSATTGLWSIVSGAGTLGASNLVGSLVNTQYTIDASDIGTTITLRLTTNDPDGPGGPCTEEFEDIDITINQAAVVSAGPDLQLCRDTPSILLQGSHSGAPTTLAWSGGLGLFSDPTLAQPLYSFNDPTEVNATVVLTLTALDPDGLGPCSAVADQMNLKINPLPVVVYTGLPPGAPSSLAENGPPITLTGNLAGGAFTILPTSSVIGSTFINVVDRAVFDPSAADLGSNFIKYTYTDGNGCTNFDEQEVFINPVTTIDFAVQGAVLNGIGEFELCSDLGLVKLLGFPVPADGFPPETQFTSEGPNAANMTIVKIGPDYFIQTSGLVSDSYRIRYTFKNQFNAITFRERTINFFGSPVSLFSSSNNCIVSDVVFTDNSIINPSPFPAAITSWQWAFGDNTFSTDQNPSKRYTTSGTFNVSLKVTTSQGCSSTGTPYVLRVGDVPIVDFSWSAICNNDNTNFQDMTTKVVGSVPPGISVITGYTWDFGDGDVLPSGVGAIPVGTHGGRTFGTYKDPQHKYVSNGTYSSTLLVDTNDGCSNSNTQNVFILPYNTVAPVAGAEYLEGFESTDGGWIAEAFNTTNSTPTNIVLSDTSWIWGMPAGAGGTINTAASGSNAWWTGKNANTYFSNENSTVNGPCFDLTQLKRPMVALDYFSDTEKNLDGSVLQYSIDGGLSWRIVGPPEGQSNRDEGINWFNGVGILSNPGSQPIGNYGWTDKQSEWKNARFNLDMIPAVNRSQVRLRIAFSSNDGNAPAPPAFDGFAFDNFFVGEKARHVLVEHFTTSTLTASTNADTYLNGLYQQQITDSGTSDFQDIQYHVNFSGTDPLNKDNPTDPAARALYFGASQPPFTIMDGLITPGKFTGSTYELNKVEIDRRALVEPIFSLSLKDTTSIDDTHISVRMFITAKQDFASPVIVNVALVEKDVNGFKNVLRKNLFGSDGKTISLGFIQNQTNKSALVFNIPIDVPISNPNGLLLIGYVQDKNTKEIYQSIVIDGPVKNGDPVVGIEDELPLITTLNNIQIFPNPANNQFTFGIPAEVYPGSQWQIIDQRGVTVLEGNFEGAVNGLKEVNVAELANAVYFVVMTGPKGVTVRKKLMVMNRN
jgi:hypothetical protein